MRNIQRLTIMFGLFIAISWAGGGVWSPGRGVCLYNTRSQVRASVGSIRRWPEKGCWVLCWEVKVTQPRTMSISKKWICIWVSEIVWKKTLCRAGWKVAKEFQWGVCLKRGFERYHVPATCLASSSQKEWRLKMGHFQLSH